MYDDQSPKQYKKKHDVAGFCLMLCIILLIASAWAHQWYGIIASVAGGIGTLAAFIDD